MIIGNPLLLKKAADSTPADPVTRSLRFNGSVSSSEAGHLYRTAGTPTDEGKWTMSMWVKVGQQPTNGYMTLFGAGLSNDNAAYVAIYNGNLYADQATSSNHRTIKCSGALFRDPNAWYHLCFAYDNSQSGSTGNNQNAYKWYVNGVRLTEPTYSHNESVSGYTHRFNSSGYVQRIGKNAHRSYNSTYKYHWDGLIANVHFVDGQQLEPTDFIEATDYGGYKPKEYTGTYGNNGFHIDAQVAHDSDLLVSSVGRNDGDTTFADAAAGHTLTSGGDPEHSIKVGNPFTGDGRAIYFDGTDDYLTVDDGANIDLGTGDFTVEFWINSDEDTQNAFITGRWNATPNVGSYSNREWSLTCSSYGSGGLDVYTSGASYSGGINVCDSKWHHIAIVRSSGDAKLYVDGEYKYDPTVLDSLNMSFSSKLLIGAGQATYWRGAMYDYRISDTARYSSDFDLPTAKFTSDSNTLLLIQPDRDDTTFHDESSSPATVTTVSSPTRTASTPYDAAAKSTAMYFDGTGDNLVVTSDSSFNEFGTGDFTIEMWVNPTDQGSGSFAQMFELYGSSSDRMYLRIERQSSQNVYKFVNNGSNSFDVESNSAPDYGNWQHLAVVRNGTSITMYVDGTAQTDSVTISSSATYNWASTNLNIGKGSVGGSSADYEGYIFDYRITKGTAQYTSNFTAPSAPFELNPVYLGGDQSGNKNHFQPTNISQTHDVMLDVPTKNYCLINPLAETKTDSSSYVANPTTGLSEGNLKLTSSGYFYNGHGTFGVSAGKWYFEWYSTGDWVQGGYTTHEMYSSHTDTHSDYWALYNQDASNNINASYKDGTSLASATWAGGGHASGNGNVYGCAFDVDNRKMYFHKNGEWSDGTSTLTSTFPSSYGGDLTGSSHNIPADTTFFPIMRPWTNSTVIANFGQDSTFANTVASGSANAADANGNGDFRYTPPSGYLALCTANLAAPTVTPAENFDVLTYAGSGSNRSITGLDFQPDLVWLKDRTTGGSNGYHCIHDSVRGDDGTHKYILSSDNTITTDTTFSGYGVTSFNSDGFSILNSGSLTNHSSLNYVAWNWKAHQSPTSTRTTYTVKVEDSGGDAWDASSSFYDSSTYLPNVYMELWENQSTGLVSLGKVAVRSLDEGGNTLSETSEQTYELKCVDLNAITVKWHYDTTADGDSSDFPNSYNDLLNEQKITILDGSTSEWTTNNSSNDDGGTNYNYSPPSGWANGDSLKSATTSYTGSDTATLTSGSGPVEKYNAAAGFSIISYTGNKSADGSDDGATQEITHSLGAEPELIITKSRGSGVYDGGLWEVYHKHTVMGSSHADNGIHPQLWLNNNYDAYQGYYNPVIPKSGSANTIIEVTNDNGYGHYANENGLEYIMYAWTPVEGYSKFGSYVGNGSSNGPFIYTGFRPAFVLWKRTTGGSNSWMIMDNKREGYNPQNDLLFPDSSTNESDVTDQDLLSNGFKLRTSAAGRNSNTDTYIYAAFAESPFKHANAR